MGTLKSSAFAIAVAAVITAGCTPDPTPPAPPTTPTLPAGISVEWERDAGGTLNAVTGQYSPALETYVTSASATTGPTTPGARTITPTATAMGGGQALPDGTASSPWNGFAGEGISFNKPTISFPGGSCSISAGPFDVVRGVNPSPDGTKAAIVVGNAENSMQISSGITIVALQNAQSCPVIVTQGYTKDILFNAPPTGSLLVNGAVVWKPDSSAVAFGLDPASSNAVINGSSILTLAATTAATPQTVIAPSTPGCKAPLGWSSSDRLLVLCWEVIPGTPTLLRSTLETLPAAGGTRRVLSTSNIRFHATGAAMLLDHYGYFVPGTNTVVFNNATDVVSATGKTFPNYRVALIGDTPGSVATALSTAPVTWHSEKSAAAGPGDPQPAIDVPNADWIDRFRR